MSPHCDTIDGPVVKAAARALEAGNVSLVLPYVPRDGEEEVKRCFESVAQLRDQNAKAGEVANRHFYETGGPHPPGGRGRAVHRCEAGRVGSGSGDPGRRRESACVRPPRAARSRASSSGQLAS
jgi:Family of unknown function (DUF6448)